MNPIDIILWSLAAVAVVLAIAIIMAIVFVIATAVRSPKKASATDPFLDYSPTTDWKNDAR